MFGNKPGVDGVAIEAVSSDALDVAGKKAIDEQIEFDAKVATAVAALSGTGEFNLPSSLAGEADLPVGKA